MWFRPALLQYRLMKTIPRLQPGIFFGYQAAPGCKWKQIYFIADLESFRGIHLNQATPASRFTHAVHATRIVRIPDYDGFVFSLKNHYVFDNGVLDIAGLSSTLYRGPHLFELD